MISRIFRGENENVALKRKRQIDTLKIFNDNVQELREDAEYQVLFEAWERPMAILVSLPPEFPLEKPVLRVHPPISHPWCNEHSEVTSAPGLLHFTVHSDLGRVVQAIIGEFRKNRPQLLEDVSPSSTKSHRDLQERNSPSFPLQQYPEIGASSYKPYYTPSYPQFSSSSVNSCIYNYNHTSADSHANNFEWPSTAQGGQYMSSRTSNLQGGGFIEVKGTEASHYSSQQGSSSSYLNSQYPNTSYPQAIASQVKSPPQSAVFPELNNLSNEELKRLAGDEDKLDEFLEKHSQLKDLNAAVDDAIDWVTKTAEANVAKEPELKRLQSEIASRVETVAGLKARYDELIHRYNKLSEAFTPDHIKECLKQAADESHEESERIAEDFLNRKIDVERFLSTYVECRKLGQARRTKEEKLAHQLNELKRAGY